MDAFTLHPLDSGPAGERATRRFTRKQTPIGNWKCIRVRWAREPADTPAAHRASRASGGEHRDVPQSRTEAHAMPATRDAGAVTTDSEPLLPTAAAGAGPGTPTATLAGIVAASASVKRRWTRTRLVKFAAVVVLAVAAVAVAVRSLRSATRARSQRRARLTQRLDGFAQSRLEGVPLRLRVEHDVPYDDLLGDPLLADHPTPRCRLNEYQQERYGALLRDKPYSRRTYFVGINLYDSADVATALIRALCSVISALGPDRFHVSVYENGSQDDTPHQLFLFAKLLRQLGAGFTLVSDPNRQPGFVPGQRIAGLAELRNVVLQPMYDAPEGTYDQILFINDVQLCEAEILEILLQHEKQQADMSCGMDFKELRIVEFEPDYPLMFYDTWVARDMQGL